MARSLGTRIGDLHALLTSRHFLSWREERKIQPIHIQPGRPMQNGHIENLNGRCARNV
jgi:transposase InsO family protein